MRRYIFIGYLVAENTRIAVIFWDRLYCEKVYQIIR